MEDFSRPLGIHSTLTLMCCIFCVFLQTDGNSISRTAGSRVTLHCNKDSNTTLIQLTWKKNGAHLFTFMPKGTFNNSLFISPEANSLNLNMSTLESQLYALIIERAQKSHTGNYTCEMAMDIGVKEWKWELIVTDGNSISRTAGSRVTLHCNKDSNTTLNQLTWKMNGAHLITFMPKGTFNNSLFISPEANSLNLNMSTLESQLYALIIERAQKSHTGNYTCEMTMDIGVKEWKWELIVTAEAENSYKIHIVTAVTVPCVCCLIFIFTVSFILRGVCKKRKATGTQYPTRLQEQQGDIYENCLELQRRQHGHIEVHPYRYRAQ